MKASQDANRPDRKSLEGPTGRVVPFLALLLGTAALVVLSCSLLVATSQAAPLKCLGHDATVTGTGVADAIRGTPEIDVIVAGAGNDVVFGTAGNDIICGGPGNDMLAGGTGNDTLAGGPGDDMLAGGTGNDTMGRTDSRGRGRRGGVRAQGVAG